MRKQPLYFLICKEVDLLTNISNTQNLPSCVEFFLQDFKELFAKEIPSGLPLIRAIEHHIDLSLGASLPNRLNYETLNKHKRYKNKYLSW